MKKITAALLFGALIGGAPHAWADYPDKTAKIIVPYSPGGAVDFVGRLVAKSLGEELDGNFIVENRDGASGNIGTQAAVLSRPDGHTLLMSALTSTAINTALRPDDVEFDLEEDLKPVAWIGEVPLVLIANQDVPVDDVDSLIDYAKDSSKPLAYSSSGVGSTEHLGAILFTQITDVDTLHVPFTGGAPAITAVVSGEVPIEVATIPTALPQIQEGNVKPLAVAMPDRLDVLPDTPTAEEAGVPDFQVSSSYVLLAPAAIEDDVRDALQKALSNIVKSEDFSKQLSDRGVIPSPEPVTDLGERYTAEIDKWHTLVKEANIEVK